MMKSIVIGNKIREARTGKNLSQSQLAQQVSISAQAVGKWERGESLPDIITLNRLAEILDVDLNYFSESFESSGLEESQFAPEDAGISKVTSGKPAIKGGWNMSGGNWVDADFSGLKNLNGRFSSSNMQRCRFVDADLSELLLKSNNVEACDFTNANISNSHIQRSNLEKNLFRDCSLAETAFSGSNIFGCDFSEVNFTGATFKTCSIQKNNLSQAVWNRTSFVTTQVTDTEFDGTLEDCAFENCSFTRVVFKQATLINTFFKNVKLKRVKFIDCKADRITYEFLKIGKADLSGVEVV